MKSLEARIALAMVATIAMSSCSRPTTSYTLDAETDVYTQSAQYSSKQVDILWVIDNSNSMQTSQTAVAQNLVGFVSKLLQAGLDFQIAVITTDTYLSNQPTFKSGGPILGASTTPIITPANAATLLNDFTALVIQGTTGDGDERPLQSIQSVLSSPDNQALFLRPQAQLSVIILTDEDDFSHSSLDTIIDPLDSRLLNPQTFLDNLEAIKPLNQLSVSSISIDNQECLTSLQNQFQERIISHRIKEVVDLSKGKSISICSDFSESLGFIVDRIAELNLMFRLSRKPNPETIVVRVNGQLAPNNTLDGYTYDPQENAIIFNGSFVPTEGAQVSIHFDPIEVKN